MTSPSMVLLIDDEAPLLFGLSAIMKRQGYQVLTAKNGTEGLSLAKSENPDVIISDIMMPSPNGFELREILSQDQTTAHIPFIFLTAKVEKEDKIRGLVGGADDYITKPFDREELIARVEAILRRSEIERGIGNEQARLDAEKEMESFRKEVLQNVRHELRTPLVNVALPLELAISNKFENPIDQVNFIKTALTNVERLHSMVEDFILLSEIDNDNLNILDQEINFESIILPAIKRRLGQYKDKNLKLELINDEKELFFGPRNEIKRAILHLVDNAFKFSPDGGLVRVEIMVLKSDTLTFIVSDEGPGIPADLRGKVFEKFYQISQGSARKYEGLGVGLTIAREIARSQGGEVAILDKQKGTTVVLSIPWKKIPDDFNSETI